jgi:hypothetical protein
MTRSKRPCLFYDEISHLCGTNKLTKRTHSADQVIGEIIDGNNAFIPIAVGTNGEFGSLF